MIKTLTLLSLFLSCAFFSQSQTAAEQNAVLKAELERSKAAYEKMEPACSAMKAQLEQYAQRLDTLEKQFPMEQLAKLRKEASLRLDTMQCLGVNTSAWEKVVRSRYPQRNGGQGSYMIRVHIKELYAVRGNLKLDGLTLEKENEKLDERIWEYNRANAVNVDWLKLCHALLIEQRENEDALRALHADYDLMVANCTQVNQTMADSLHVFRKLIVAQPDKGKKYKYCFEKQREPEMKPEPPRVLEPVILDVVEEPADFPGGKEAMNQYLKDNLKYPEEAKKKGIEGKTYVRFVISESGNISNVRVARGVQDCPECDAEAVRVVKAMPNWIPGKNNGRPVNMWYNLPIAFKL